MIKDKTIKKKKKKTRKPQKHQIPLVIESETKNTIQDEVFGKTE